MNDSQVFELKSVFGDLLNKIVELFPAKQFEGLLRAYLQQAYDKGMDKVSVEVGMNFFRDERKFSFLADYAFQNIKGMNDEIADKLRKELQLALINMESAEQMKKRVMKVMGVAEDRARMIARTEMVRAENQGGLDAARQSELKLLKVWLAKGPRVCEICSALDGQKKFLSGKFRVGGKVFDAPPAHPNCACALVYEQK